MTDPSPEEIARVDAWRSRQQDRSFAESMRKRSELEAKERSDLAQRIVGRRIEGIDKEDSVQDGSEWRRVCLLLTDGVRLAIEYSSWSDPPEISIEVTG